MVEEEPEYGDAQLMTWNPHVGRSPTGWDDYARREREPTRAQRHSSRIAGCGDLCVNHNNSGGTRHGARRRRWKTAR